MNEDIETQAEVRRLAQALLRRGGAPLTLRERRMIERIARRVEVHDLNEDMEDQATLGERIADRVAAIGGSWRFILGFSAFLVAWMVLNAVVMGGGAFDPAPFIGLNLVLSCLAALQAPIIMMSQNRQAKRDRAASDLDYDTNLRSETHILAVLEKVDALQSQVERLLAERRGRAAPEGEGEDERVVQMEAA
jgi:uncharacterized membrane protein